MNAEICKKANLTVAAASIIVLITGIFLSLLFFSGCSRQQGIISEQYEYDNEGRLISRITPDNSGTKCK